MLKEPLSPAGITPRTVHSAALAGTNTNGICGTEPRWDFPPLRDHPAAMPLILVVPRNTRMLSTLTSPVVKVLRFESFAISIHAAILIHAVMLILLKCTQVA